MGVIRLFVCARATLDRRIRLGEKTPVAREFVGNAQVEAKLRACAQASSHGLSLQYMNLTADRGQQSDSYKVWVKSARAFSFAHSLASTWALLES